MAENESAIERIAKAIAKVRECEPTVEQVASCIWGHDNVEDYSCICLIAARAAIEALRAPTEEMLAAADSAIPCFEPDENGHRLMGRDGALDVWRAMIDTALPSSTAGRET